MSKSFALVFPGQGSQHLGMLNELADKYSVINDHFDQASEVLGYDLWSLTQNGPEDLLNQTHRTQPALLVAGVCIWEIWKKSQLPAPQFLAGHSLGEYTALVCANVLPFKTAVNLVEQRGQFMQEAVPPGKGGMAALIGLNPEQVSEVCALASNDFQQVSPANYNSIGQIVIAGDVEAVDSALNYAKEMGAKLAKKLLISVPSHCNLMKPAAIRLAEELQKITFKKPEYPVINNVDVRNYSQPDQIKDALIRQLYSPVRWIETVQFLANNDIHLIIESGPGKVLTGLNKRIATDITALSIHQPDSFQEALDLIGG